MDDMVGRVKESNMDDDEASKCQDNNKNNHHHLQGEMEVNKIATAFSRSFVRSFSYHS